MHYACVHSPRGDIRCLVNLSSHVSPSKDVVKLTKHTRHNANGNGNRNPDKILRNIDPGIANDCRLIKC